MRQSSSKSFLIGIFKIPFCSFAFSLCLQVGIQFLGSYFSSPCCPRPSICLFPFNHTLSPLFLLLVFVLNPWLISASFIPPPVPSLFPVIAFRLYWLHLPWPWRAQCRLLSPKLGAATLASGLNTLAYVLFWKTALHDCDTRTQPGGGVIHMHTQESVNKAQSVCAHKHTEPVNIPEQFQISRLGTVTYSYVCRLHYGMTSM